MTTELKIDIDIDIHKVIEAARLSFDEHPNDILRRLLLKTTSIEPQSKTNKSWSGKGVTLLHGTEIEMTYNNQFRRGIIHNGRWKIENQYFNSPSDAAAGVSEMITGERKSLNGWIYWIAKPPGQVLWKKIGDMRRANEINRKIQLGQPV